MKSVLIIMVVVLIITVSMLVIVESVSLAVFGVIGLAPGRHSTASRKAAAARRRNGERPRPHCSHHHHHPPSGLHLQQAGREGGTQESGLSISPSVPCCRNKPRGNFSSEEQGFLRQSLHLTKNILGKRKYLNFCFPSIISLSNSRLDNCCFL